MSGYQQIKFDRVYQVLCGGFNIVLGRITGPESASFQPVVYAAALSERELRNERCGYGTTEAEAITDLFRLMRPANAQTGVWIS